METGSLEWKLEVSNGNWKFQMETGSFKWKLTMKSHWKVLTQITQIKNDVTYVQ